MTPIDILPNHIYTNGNGRFRLVTEVLQEPNSAWRDVCYRGAYLSSSNGKMKMLKPNRATRDDKSGVWSFAKWSEREATEAEAQAVRAVLS